ncbi:MAG: hypothetical protein HY863_00860 [Chloroflexi bacterium]|nr:hypothetical protein [Chloroflexota bacterium]
MDLSLIKKTEEMMRNHKLTFTIKKSAIALTLALLPRRLPTLAKKRICIFTKTIAKKRQADFGNHAKPTMNKAEAAKQSQPKPTQCLGRFDNQPKRKPKTLNPISEA